MFLLLFDLQFRPNLFCSYFVIINKNKPHSRRFYGIIHSFTHVSQIHCANRCIGFPNTKFCRRYRDLLHYWKFLISTNNSFVPIPLKFTKLKHLTSKLLVHKMKATTPKNLLCSNISFSFNTGWSNTVTNVYQSSFFES